MLSQQSLKLSSTLKNLFFFLLFCLCNFHYFILLMHASVSPSLLLIPSSVFSFLLLYYSALTCSFFIFSSFLLKFSLCSSIFSQVQLSFLWLMLWTLTGKLFISITLGCFLVLSFETYPSVFSFFENLCLYEIRWNSYLSQSWRSICMGASLCNLCAQCLWWES